jgi:hypothetical protein
MLTNIYTTKYVQATYLSTPHISNSGQLAGTIRFNTDTQHTEVFTGTHWVCMDYTGTIGLSADAEIALDWCLTKIDEEKALQRKMEEYPTLKAAYEQYKMVEALVHEEEKIGT